MWNCIRVYPRATPRLRFFLAHSGNVCVRFRAGCGIRNQHTCAIPSWATGSGILAAKGLAMVWSMDRQGIRTSFDRESKRLKQVELSAPRRERVSLDTYADALAAREAEFRQEAKYSEWSESESNVWR